MAFIIKDKDGNMRGRDGTKVRGLHEAHFYANAGEAKNHQRLYHPEEGMQVVELVENPVEK